jgi:hypothetical protein
MGEPAQKIEDVADCLDILKYAKKWQVSRSTIFTWMRIGVLVRGRHYVKIGRVLRFFWELHLIREIDQARNSLEREDDKGEQNTGKSSTIVLTKAKKPRAIQPSRTVANLDY